MSLSDGRRSESIGGIAETYYPGTWYLAGQGVSTYDLMDTVTSDMVKVNALAIAAVSVGWYNIGRNDGRTKVSGTAGSMIGGPHI